MASILHTVYIFMEVKIRIFIQITPPKFVPNCAVKNK